MSGRDAPESSGRNEGDVRKEAPGPIGQPGKGSPGTRPSQPTPSPSPGPPPVPPPGPPRTAPAVEPPSPDVELASDASPLPGAHRGGFARLPTAPVGVTSTTAPSESGAEPAPAAQWLMPEPPVMSRGLAAWALTFSIVGLVVSLFVGWGFPIGLVGAVTALVALRRPVESRAVAVWALVLGCVSVLYSAGWLLWAASRSNLVG